MGVRLVVLALFLCACGSQKPAGTGDELPVDTDADGLVDGEDNCPAVANPNQADRDSDGTGDACDNDADGDGVADTVDNCPLVGAANQSDSDHDGQGNVCDDDDDGDGVADAADGCPLLADAGQADMDGDGTGDVCDDDVDGDGVADVADNCLGLDEPDQTNTDGDQLGDACDPDDDGDGVDDADDDCPLLADASQTDTDGDTLGDVCDSDIDGDGLSNDIEIAAGTDPLIIDSDSDTIADGDEGLGDTDGDDVVDALDPDSDDDGVSDADEAGDVLLTTPPIDTDGDTVADYRDLDSDGDTVLDVDENFCGGARLNVDADGDGFADAVERMLGVDACDSLVTPLDLYASVVEVSPSAPTVGTVLALHPRVHTLDLVLDFDISGSMGPAITNVSNGFSGTFTPLVSAMADSVAYAVTVFDDFPVCDHGFEAAQDIPYALKLAVTPNSATAATQIAALPSGILNGGDTPEAALESLYQIATGEGVAWTSEVFRRTCNEAFYVTHSTTSCDATPIPSVSCSAGMAEPRWSAGSVPAYAGSGAGGVGFRDNAVRFVGILTDAGFHQLGDYVRSPRAPNVVLGSFAPQAGAHANGADEAIRQAGLHPILWSTNVSGTSPSWVPYFAANLFGRAGSGSTATVMVDAVRDAVRYDLFDMRAVTLDDGDAGTPDTSCFIQRLTASTSVKPPSPPENTATPTATTVELGAVGYKNGFRAATGTADPARPGMTLSFTVTGKNDGCVIPTASYQLFVARTELRSVPEQAFLDDAEILIIVPPAAP